MYLLSVILFLIILFCCRATNQESEGIEKRFKDLENTVSHLFDQNAERNLEIKHLQEANRNLEKKIQYQADILSVNDIKAPDGVKRGIRPKQLENVAFYVYLSGNRCYSNHETFVFDVVETNNGNGYTRNDGIFDVPVTGTYVFTVTAGCMANTYFVAEIIVNGSVKGKVWANSEEINDIHTGSNTIVVHVNAGDHVFVRRGEGNKDCSIHSGYTWTSFTGWLLF